MGPELWVDGLAGALLVFRIFLHRSEMGFEGGTRLVNP
jgi:hypothetical protein